MASEQAVTEAEKDSKVKRGLLVLGALVGFLVFWFFIATFMYEFVDGFGGTSPNPIFKAIAAGVFVAPFVHVLFGRLVDFVSDQL